jgi:predicted ATPase
MCPTASAPYLSRVGVVASRLPAERAFPFSLPFVAGLDLCLQSPVTFFVGENGSGKSTLLEAIAALSRLPVSGGSRNDLGAITDRSATVNWRELFAPRSSDPHPMGTFCAPNSMRTLHRC